MVPANIEWLQPPSFCSSVGTIMGFCPCLIFSTNSSSKSCNSLPVLTCYFLQVTCPPCLWEIICSQTSNRCVTLQNKMLSHKEFQSSIPFLPQNQIQNFLLLGRNTPQKSFTDLELEFICALQLVFQHLLLLTCRSSFLSHLLSAGKDGLADTIAFLQMQL